MEQGGLAEVHAADQHFNQAGFTAHPLYRSRRTSTNPKSGISTDCSKRTAGPKQRALRCTCFPSICHKMAKVAQGDRIPCLEIARCHYSLVFAASPGKRT